LVQDLPETLGVGLRGGFAPGIVQAGAELRGEGGGRGGLL